jgi:DNA invertase Pin-like site-specific DNA recombinase
MDAHSHLKAPISKETKERFQRGYKDDADRKLATQLPTYGKRIKFTPERIQQIRNLVEQGKSREEIAELIDVTVRFLQITCSRLGIGVRRSSLPAAEGG